MVDTAALVHYAHRLSDVVYAAQIGYGCFDEGQIQIKEAIEEYRLNRVVIVGCSHRTHESLFQRTVRQAGLNPYLMEMVNIREHCAWVHSAYPQAATRKAVELLRIGIERALHVRFCRCKIGRRRDQGGADVALLPKASAKPGAARRALPPAPLQRLPALLHRLIVLILAAASTRIA